MSDDDLTDPEHPLLAMHQEASTLCDCGKAATALCDFTLPRRRGTESRTCDKPLCDDCRTQVGATFGSGEEGFADSLDYCPAHAKPWLEANRAKALAKKTCLKIAEHPDA